MFPAPLAPEGTATIVRYLDKGIRCESRRGYRLLAWAMTKQLERDPARVAPGECEDTVELELSAEQVLALTRADAAIRPDSNSLPVPLPSLPVPVPRRAVANAPKDERGAWRAIIARISVASLLSGGIAYLATTPGQPVNVGGSAIVRPAATHTLSPPSTDTPDTLPVRFTNPFDATEVFEFPSGTSETEARQAVADLLLQRARERQKSASKATYQRSAQQG